MGFFSWDCAECGESIRNLHTHEHQGIVWVKPDRVHRGPYEGYGMVDGHDAHAWAGPVKMLHPDCYNQQAYLDLEESPDAYDQGFF